MKAIKIKKQYKKKKTSQNKKTKQNKKNDNYQKKLLLYSFLAFLLFTSGTSKPLYSSNFYIFSDFRFLASN